MEAPKAAFAMWQLHGVLLLLLVGSASPFSLFRGTDQISSLLNPEVLKPNPERLSSMIKSSSDQTQLAPGVTYIPSHLETNWTENVDQWTSQEEYCDRVNSYTRHIDHWLTTCKELMASTRLAKYKQRNPGIFSVFEKKVACNGQTIISWIEPLAFSLRHPRGVCPSPKKHLVDREYLLLSSIREINRQACAGPPPKKFFFDLGASTWDEGKGGSSQQWFVEAYGTRGIKFDRMLMWEATPYNSTEIFSKVPSTVYHSYQYFNVPVSSEVDDPANPLNILKQITRKTDFVVLKIDIDNNPIETALIHQLLTDPEIYSRVDEFYFEHHVNFAPMFKLGWATDTSSEHETLRDSYALFGALRQKGIRAHGWP